MARMAQPTQWGLQPLLWLRLPVRIRLEAGHCLSMIKSLATRGRWVVGPSISRRPPFLNRARSVWLRSGLQPTGDEDKPSSQDVDIEITKTFASGRGLFVFAICRVPTAFPEQANAVYCCFVPHDEGWEIHPTLS